MVERLTLEDFLARHNCLFVVSDYTLDKTVFPHGLTQRKHDKLNKECLKHAEEYTARRNFYKQEYKKLVEAGEIIKPSSIELTIRRANGHPDLESTQAARRLCVKRGIDWQATTL